MTFGIKGTICLQVLSNIEFFYYCYNCWYLLRYLGRSAYFEIGKYEFCELSKHSINQNSIEWTFPRIFWNWCSNAGYYWNSRANQNKLNEKKGSNCSMEFYCLEPNFCSLNWPLSNIIHQFYFKCMLGKERVREW